MAGASQVLNMHVCIEYVSGKPTLLVQVHPASWSGLRAYVTSDVLERANTRCTDFEQAPRGLF